MTEAAKINVDEAAILESCKRGDFAAMETLILRYQNRIYNVILKICANNDDAAELTQETFVKVIENIDKFQGRSSFYTWAFRIAVNLTLNYCKRSVKLGMRSLDAGKDDGNGRAKQMLRHFLIDESCPDPAEVVADTEVGELLKKALSGLDDDQRTVIVLRDIEGMNYAQIAEVLDLELGTVKSRISRGRSNLREIMETILE